MGSLIRAMARAQARSRTPSLMVGRDADLPEPRHCDDFIEDLTQPECLRQFLDYHRLPATAKYPTGDDAFDARMEAYQGCPMWRVPVPVLFADHEGKRVRVTMASRFGDVGITTHLDAETGYGRRVPVEALSGFSETA